MVILCLPLSGSSWTQGSGTSAAYSVRCDLTKRASCSKACFKRISLGAFGPPLNIFLYGPAHAIYHGFRTHKGSSLLICCFSQVATPLSSPRPFLDPQLAPQLGIKGVGSIPYIPLNPPSLPGALA